MAATADFTVFYSHPFYGTGQYTVARGSAKQVGEDAADMLPEDFCNDDQPEGIDLDTIRDDLDIRVYAGRFDVEPTGLTPSWVFE